MTGAKRGSGRTDGDGGGSLYDLLNTAFEGWGDEAYFRFKYEEFPGYDPDEHDFVVEADDRVVAARRVFAKRLRTPGGESHPVHVQGGAVVHPDHREQGLFTRLVEESKAYSRASGSPVVMTYNRHGKVSTDAHLRRGWEYRTLPLHIRPLSPKRLVMDHGSDVLPSYPGVDALAAVGGTVAGAVLPDWLFGRGTELVTSGTVSRPIASASRAARANGEEREGSRSDEDVTIRPYRPSDVDGVRDRLAAEVDRAEVAFERDREHVEHMVNYDHATALVATREGTVVGFVCTGLIYQDGLTEARVFDLVGPTAAVGERLLDRACANASDRGADVVTVLRDERPGPEWASLRTDLVMWDYLRDRERWHPILSEGEWRITGYDVL